jgi:hypothetical protein
MIFPRRIIHFLGLSIGFPLRVFKWRHRKPKLNHTLLEESNRMLPKILSQDSNYDEWCEQEILNAYQEAAECDEYLFGDYNYSKEWLGKCNDDVK